MRKLLILLTLTLLFVMPVSALEITAPPVPDSGKAFMPETRESFADGLLSIVHDALMALRPDLREALQVCVSAAAAVMVISVLRLLPSMKTKAADMGGVVTVAALLLHSSDSMVNLGIRTVSEISGYGKMLLPVMTSALAAQGGVSSSAALYAGTAVFDAVLCGLIENILAPMIYFFLTLCTACAAVGEDMLKNSRDMIKSFMVWLLKTLLYVFTGYISITGVVSGSTDAAALKAAKLTISGVVPVVGGILSDASEAVLVTAGTVKNAAGIYGMLAVIAVWIGPFLKIGLHYMLLKLTGAVCSIFGSKEMSGLISDFSTAMGMLLAMTGSVCLMLMISLVCFMRGVG